MKRLKLLATMSIMSLLVSCGPLINKNFHTVKMNYVYRSAQLPATPVMLVDEEEENYKASRVNLEDVIKEYNIQTVINLRGINKSTKWYEEEELICKKYGIEHYSIKFSAGSLPRKKDLLKIFEIFDNARYPMLIHCKAGADRTGLISTIYKLDQEKKPLEEALGQLYFIPYGHIPLFGTKAMDNFFKLYKEFGNEKNIRTWIKEDYNECKYKYFFK